MDRTKQEQDRYTYFQGTVSMRRIINLLEAEELDPETVQRANSPGEAMVLVLETWKLFTLAFWHPQPFPGFSSSNKMPILGFSNRRHQVNKVPFAGENAVQITDASFTWDVDDTRKDTLSK